LSSDSLVMAGEAVSAWGAEHRDIEHPFRGMEFLTLRSVILRTKVRSGSLICPGNPTERVCI
jgi:hypothetical protein